MQTIQPEWSVAGIQAFSTTRSGGVSAGPWASLNLGGSCGDNPAALHENRQRLASLLPGPPCWLEQVHGNRVIHLDDWQPGIEADAAWTDRPGEVLVIQAADCLPLLLVDPDAGVAAAAHAGWRGLAADIPGRLVQALPVAPGRLVAWIGPGIGVEAYAVGESIRSAFLEQSEALSGSFVTDKTGQLYCDLKDITRRLLERAGVGSVFDSGLCTAADPGRFFSYRRDGQCGRMATICWME